MTNWNTFWTAFGAIGTTLGAFATAVAVWVSLRPYKRAISVDFSMRGYDDGNEHFLVCHNLGQDVLISYISLLCDGSIAADCIDANSPVLIRQNEKYEYILSDQELDAICFHLKKANATTLQAVIYFQDHGYLKKTIDLGWFVPIMHGVEEAVCCPPSEE